MFSFFKRRNIDHPHLYSNIHTDFNTRLIPGLAGKGVDNLDESIHYLRSLEALGFKKVIATPPVKSFIYPNSSEQILKGYQLVKNRLDAEKIAIQFEVAAKYFLDENFEELLRKDDVLTFGKKYVLVSLSLHKRNENLNQILFDLTTKGFTPVLAHPERYSYFLNKINRLYLIRDMGCLFQIDLLSSIGFHGEAIRRFTLEIIAEKMVDFVASNFHDGENLREISTLPPSIQSILKKMPLMNNTL